MNPTNRPVDMLLSIESPSINLSQRRGGGASNTQGAELSALNRKGNSFEDVYRQQRREDSNVRQPVQQRRAAEQPARADQRASQAQPTTPVKQTKADNKNTEDGKALPQASADNQRHQDSVTGSSAAAEKVAAGQQQSLEPVEDMEVTVSFDVSGLPMTADEDELATQQVTEQPDANLEEVLDAGPLALAVATEQQADEINNNLAEAEADAEQGLNEEQALADQEALVLQARQAESAQQAATKTAAADVNARAAQLSSAAADVAREFKQNPLGEAIENTLKADINSATATKAAASGSETTAQPPQDRLAQLTAAMDFKAVREQLAADTVKVDGAAAINTAKGAQVGALDAMSAADGAADRQPRLNSLTQASQALAQVKPGVVSASVQSPVGSPEWGQAMSQRIMWLANRGISAAELQLNPRDLGPVDVRISVNGDQTTVQFSSQHAGVREALESSVVRLREMMESSGLNLADVDVSDQSHSEQAQADAGDHSARGSSGETDESNSSAETVVTQRMESDGLVDFYA